MNIVDYRCAVPNITLDDVVCEDIWKMIFDGGVSVDYLKSSAFLFAGETGTGKSTIAKALAGTAFAKRKCDLFRIPVSDILGTDSQNALLNINLFFKEMITFFSSGTADDPEEKKSYFVFFEDLEDLQTEILQNCFFRNLDKLLQQTDFSVIVAATYPQPAGAVPPAFRKHLYVFALELPDMAMRKKYFAHLGYSSKKTELFLNLTKGFSFGEMAELHELVSMCNVSDDESLDGVDIETIFGLIQSVVIKGRYVEPKPISPIPYVSVVGGVPQSDSENLPDVNTDLDAIEEEVKKEVKQEWIDPKMVDDAEKMELANNPF